MRPPTPDIGIIHLDSHIVVVDKPAGLTTVRHKQEAREFGARARRFLPPTLVDLLPPLLQREGRGGGRGARGRKVPRPSFPAARLRAVHRLDKETSGLLVLARTPQAEADLGRQFRAHTIERRYLAIVRGQAKDERIESYLVPDRGDGRRGSATTPGQGAVADASGSSGSRAVAHASGSSGSRAVAHASGSEGQHAVTHVRVLQDFGEFALVECRLETGRTHQVRIHLGERGTPLCGERVYDRPLHGVPLPDPSRFGRPALHAAYLGFRHPQTGRRLSFSAPLPEDMRELLKELRRKAGFLR